VPWGSTGDAPGPASGAPILINDAPGPIENGAINIPNIMCIYYIYIHTLYDICIYIMLYIYIYLFLPLMFFGVLGGSRNRFRVMLQVYPFNGKMFRRRKRSIQWSSRRAGKSMRKWPNFVSWNVMSQPSMKMGQIRYKMDGLKLKWPASASLG
jgi:hypothetical protein